MLRGKHKIRKISEDHADQSSLFPADQFSLYDSKVQLLVARYYYLLNVNSEKMKYEDILVRLSKEFFISTGRIADILSDKIDEIQKLRLEAPKPSWFKINWAHLVW